MNYKIAHTTTYTYSEPVPVCHNQVLLTPRDDARIHCRSHRLLIRPLPTVSSRRLDFFGNHVHAFSIEESHRQLTISSTCRVKVDPPPAISLSLTPAWEVVAEAVAAQQAEGWLEAWPMLCDSPRIVREEGFAEYGRASFAPQRPIGEALLDLTARIHTDFVYDKHATDVQTSTGVAFRQRRGVCQDFAHVQIACLRALGIPARYVSGYLRTVPPPDAERLVGADQSHAWVSAYCGEVGWLDVDPTNSMLVATDHIPVAYGRDYTDVAPIRGIFLGGGTHSLSVSVDVSPLQR